MSDFKAKMHQIRISAGAPPHTPLGELAALPRSPADPIPALGPPGLETTCLPKYISLNPLMTGTGTARKDRKTCSIIRARQFHPGSSTSGDLTWTRSVLLVREIRSTQSRSDKNSGRNSVISLKGCTQSGNRVGANPTFGRPGWRRCSLINAVHSISNVDGTLSQHHRDPVSLKLRRP